MQNIPDVTDLFLRHDREQEEKRQRLPKCGCCGETVFEDSAYMINGDLLCRTCLEDNYRIDIYED